MTKPIKIASITARTTLVPPGELGGPWREVFASGIPVSWVRVTSTDGVFGDSVGLVDPPLLLTPNVLAMRQIADRVIGLEFTNPRSVWNLLRTTPRGVDWRLASQTALGQLDIALWDLLGKTTGQPLHAMIGAFTEEVPIYVSWGLGLTPIEELVECYETQTAATGARMIKMAIGNQAPKDDVAKVAALREAIGWERDIAIDAQAQWSRTLAPRMLADLEDQGLHWVEEPTGIGTEDAALARAGFRVATGENLLTVREFAGILSDGFDGYIQPDIVRMGGITPTLDVLALANTYGVRVAPHCYRSLSAPIVASATAGGVVEFLGLESVVQQAIIVDPVVPSNGHLPLTSRPGIGDVVDPERFAAAGPALAAVSL